MHVRKHKADVRGELRDFGTLQVSIPQRNGWTRSRASKRKYLDTLLC